MRSRFALTIALASAMWTSSTAAPQKERCGTRQPSVEEAAQIEQQIARGRTKVKATVTIPVWVHVITKGAGFANGSLSDDMIRAQIRVLDDSYSGRTGGAGSEFDFQLAGITRTVNQAWFESMATDLDVELQAKESLHRGGRKHSTSIPLTADLISASRIFRLS
jgi:hypothetical protein